MIPFDSARSTLATEFLVPEEMVSDENGLQKLRPGVRCADCNGFTTGWRFALRHCLDNYRASKRSFGELGLAHAMEAGFDAFLFLRSMCCGIVFSCFEK